MESPLIPVPFPAADRSRNHQQPKLNPHPSSIMDTTNMPLKTSLFQVYLRLRPPIQQKSSGEWLLVEPPTNADSDAENTEMLPHSTHITLQPPNDSRKRAIERFGFTKIFGEDASQLEVFDEVGAMENIKGVLQNGRDGLIATLGVTGSGKV